MLNEGSMGEADQERVAQKEVEGKVISPQERSRVRWMNMFRQRFDIEGLRADNRYFGLVVSFLGSSSTRMMQRLTCL